MREGEVTFFKFTHRIEGDSGGGRWWWWWWWRGVEKGERGWA